MSLVKYTLRDGKAYNIGDNYLRLFKYGVVR